MKYAVTIELTAELEVDETCADDAEATAKAIVAELCDETNVRHDTITLTVESTRNVDGFATGEN